LLEPILSYYVEAEKVDKVEKWDVEGCIVNVANVVAVEGVVVGDAEDVPSSIVESVWLVVVVVVQVVFPWRTFLILTFSWSLGPGAWSMDPLYT
jgi:hypothetical protein